jgi:hypothetical protein
MAPAIDGPAVKPPPLPPEEVEEVVDGFKPMPDINPHEAEVPVEDEPEEAEHQGESGDAGDLALGELGRFLTEAGERITDLDQLFAEATRPFRELEGLVTAARAAADAAAAATEQVAALELELEQASSELAEFRGLTENAQEGVDAERQLREESEARTAEAQTRLSELERELRVERDRVAKLEGSLAHAEVSIATSVQEANSARKRAEAARLEAEAARLEAMAARQDVETAQLEAEAFLQDAGSARSEAERLRRAAHAAIEHMQAAQSEPDAESADAHPWLAEMLAATRSEGKPDGAEEREPIVELTVEPEAALPAPETFDAGASESVAFDAEEPAELEADEYAVGEGEVAGEGEDPAPAPETDRYTQENEDGEVWTQDTEDELVDDESAPEEEPNEPAGPVSPLTWSHSAKLALTAVIVDSASARHLLEPVVRVIGSRGGWDLVIAWKLDPKFDCWVCSDLWSARPDDSESLEKGIRQLRLDRESPIARVAADGRLSWLGGADAAARAGLTVLDGEALESIVVLPLVCEEERIGVIQLCSRHEGPPSEDLRRALEAIAIEVASTHQALEAVGAPDSPRWNKWRRR